MDRIAGLVPVVNDVEQLVAWAQLFGPELPIDEVAAKAETIAYELLTGISARVERVYEGGLSA